MAHARTRGRNRIFGIHNRLVEFRFKEIESFIDHSREGMNATWMEFSKEFDRTTAGWTEAEISDYVDHIYDDLAMLRDESPRLLRHAQCMIVYGTFESAIVGLCRALHRDRKIAQAPAIKMYMDDVKGYLQPHLRARPEPFANDWQWMHEFRIIRNWLAHNGGKVQKDTHAAGKWAQANRFVRRNRGLIKFGGVGEIAIEDTLVDRAVIKAEGAFDRLQRAAQRLY